MRDLPFTTADQESILLDVETATFSIPLREGTSLDEAALKSALDNAGFGLGSVRIAHPAGDAAHERVAPD